MNDTCPKCGSGRTRTFSHYENDSGITYDMECRDCGHIFSYDEKKERKK